MPNIHRNSQYNASNRRLRLLGAAFVIALLSGCNAMQGVNVGASVPIGGIVKVGANKTIGQDQSPSDVKKLPAPKSEESERDQDSSQ